MDDRKDKSTAPAAGTAKVLKPYTKPLLRVYGAVAELTMAGTLSKGDGSQMMNPPPSDRRVKQDITRVGDHPSGVGVYVFRYCDALAERYGAGWHVGVMADEIQRVVPDAVSMHKDGYLTVDYRLVGPLFPRH